jgi:putative peptidoglycan lipid II flippase
LISFARFKRQIIAPTAASISLTLVITAGALLAKAFGLGKELAVAYELGAGPELDAFLFAYMFPALLVTVIGGAVGASIVPRFLATEAQESPQAANRLAAETATLVAGAATLLALLGVPLVTWLVPLLAGGFSPATQALTVSMVPVLMPIAAFSVLSSLWSGLLNARHRFSAAAFVPMITPILVVTCLLSAHAGLRPMALAVGTVLGAATEVGILAGVARRAGLDLFLWPKAWRPEYGHILRQFLPAAGSSLLMSGTILIDQSFAANLATGSLSALSYGSKLAAVAASVLVVIVSTLALPVFSRLAAVDDLVKLRRSFFTACVIVAGVTVPIAAVLSFGARPIIEVLFMRGSFTADDASLAASVQLLHAWHVPVYVMGIVAVRALAAISETWLMLVGSAANLIADFSVNALLVPVMGVAAIGLATTTMYTVSALVLCTGFLIRIGLRIRRRSIA